MKMPFEQQTPTMVEPNPAAPYLDHLIPALNRLDSFLARAVSVANALYGPEAAADSFRGLHISQLEVEKLLIRAPGEPLLWTGSLRSRYPVSPDEPNFPLQWLAETFDLSPFDLDAVLISLAPELDLRYERLYAFLQNDVTRRRPSVDLLLNLLCGSAGEKLTRRAHFDPDSPLIRHRVAHLV